MTITIIVAISDNNVIGRDNALPWHLPADLKYFRQKTTGHHIVMGRKTFESIGGGRPLPNRTSIIVTHQENYQAVGCLVANNLGDALSMADGQEQVYIIGGKQIYEQSMSFAHQLLVTRVHAQFEGDTQFPSIDPSTWQLTGETHCQPDEKNPYPYSFQVYSRKTHS